MEHYSQHITRAIHWAMAVLILALLSVGFFMTTYENYTYYPLHKSLGVIAMLAIIIRVFYRVYNPWTSAMQGHKSEKLVKRVHLSIIVLLLLMPISGLLLSGFGGFGVSLFGLEIIPSNYDSNGKAVPFNAAISNLGYAAHPILALILIGLLGLHILAALKHHLIDRDNTLRRMLGTKT